MNFSATAALSVIPLVVSATPHTELLQNIQSSYNPAIEFYRTDTSRSLYGCRIEDFQIVGMDPVNQQKRKVNVSIYRSAGPGKKKMVVILPPTGGVNILDRGYANEMCSLGLTVALVSGWDHQGERSLDFNMHNNGALRALVATRHVIEFLQTEAPDSVGILGTSIGAVAGVLVMAFEPRVSSAALIVGSARFADIVADSDEAGTSSLRQQRMSHLGLHSREQYRDAVRASIKIDPALFMNQITKRPVLVVSADADTTVPSQHQYEMANWLQAEKHLQLRGDHRQVIKDSFFRYRKDIVGFFLER